MAVRRACHEARAIIPLPDGLEEVGLGVVRVDVEQHQAAPRGGLPVAQRRLPPDEVGLVIRHEARETIFQPGVVSRELPGPADLGRPHEPRVEPQRFVARDIRAQQVISSGGAQPAGRTFLSRT